MSKASNKNYHLDAMRGIAAILVVLTHVRQVFFLPYKLVDSSLLLVKIIYLDHYIARGAVIFFFSLSGYLVGSSIISSASSNRWSWKNYLITRTSRLYAVLIPALILTLVLDLVGYSLPVTHASYSLNINGATPLIEYNTLTNFLGSLFYLQTIYTMWYGSNSPLWSLSYEFWYYILFPLGYLALRGKRKFLFMALFFLTALFVKEGVMSLFPCWLSGIAAGYLARKYVVIASDKRVIIGILSFLVWCTAIILAAAHHIAGIWGDYILALGACGMIWCALVSKQSNNKFYNTIASKLSDFSFSLYLTHLPVLIFISAIWLRGTYWPPDIYNLLRAIFPVFCCIVLAYLFFQLFESKTDFLRRKIKALLNSTS